MKKKLFSILISLCLVLVPFKVFAANASISLSGGNSAVVGSTITVNVTLSSSVGIGSWEYLINYDSSRLQLISGNTKVVDYSQVSGGVKSKTYTLKFKALKSGAATVSVGSYEMYSYSDEAAMNVSAGSKTIKIITQAELEASYSKNNNLSSLSVNGYEITPAFDKNTLEYKVELPASVENIDVAATAEDSKSKISGTGSLQVAEGDNKFEIVVTAENGSTKTYVLVASVVDENPIKVTVSKKEYTLIKRASLLTKPELFTETTVKINDLDIPAFYNETAKITLVGLKDTEGNVSLFVYDNDKYYQYKELRFSNVVLMLLDNSNKVNYFNKADVTINDIKYDCLKSNKKSKFSLFYGMNLINGEKGYYLYEETEQTLQKYDGEVVDIVVSELKKVKKQEKIFMGLSGVLLLFNLITLIAFIKKNGKIKKIINQEK